MAVQAQFYSDHNNNNNNINNMGCSNMPQDWCYMSNSSLFGFGDEYQQDQGFLDSQKVVNFDSGYRKIGSASNSRGNGMIEFQNLSCELERQRLEMNCFLHLQNEKLKAVLNEETRKRELILMHNYESKMKAIFYEKDEVLNTATIRAKKLQNYVLMAEKEAKIWEKKAIESEAIMTDLNKKLIQARARTHEDAESVCNGDDHSIINNHKNNGKERQEKMVCKMCHVRSTCVLLLPCKHLCCCTHCEGLVMFCPVCETVKNGSLEVFFGLN
ncbi:E3 ubiquitin-protein ligase BOI-like [Bidens hawaiensis]|uniref:E3 ubiquitin-protein ligase BOI-like n=1 Tax=Bidens hawaiensis TaxID=980011 RepID=UPI00404B3208